MAYVRLPAICTDAPPEIDLGVVSATVRRCRVDGCKTILRKSNHGEFCGACQLRLGRDEIRAMLMEGE